MAISTIPLSGTPIQDIKSKLSITPSTKAGSATISTAYMSGNIIQIRGNVITNASVSSGDDIECKISGFTVIGGGSYGTFVSLGVYGLMWQNGDHFTLRPMNGNLGSGRTCTFAMMFIGELSN